MMIIALCLLQQKHLVLYEAIVEMERLHLAAVPEHIIVLHSATRQKLQFLFVKFI